MIDARPMTNAIANMALGGGYENTAFYPDTEIEFLGIGNIHTVRDSYNKLRDLCELQGKKVSFSILIYQQTTK
jgi:myotubularin-related protein 1/2